MNTFEFRDLFIFEMANNHQGSLEHGLRIIDEMARIARANEVRAAVKLQFRHLDSFVHPAHRENTDNKHIPRFLSTRLSQKEFGVMVEAMHDQGLISMCTPFDEPSVEMIQDLGIQVAKIGSPSATDWPLIEAVAETGLPVVYSTGGLSIKEIDDLASFSDHRMIQYALMHCVSIYPTPPEDLNLVHIRMLRERYPDTPVGWSGHEDPDDVTPVQLAIGMGATLFERHVGVPTDEISLNAYSMNPEQVDRWIKAYKRARTASGTDVGVRNVTAQEAASLEGLRRGVYARRNLKAGMTLDRNDVYFAMPYIAGQLSSGRWKAGTVLQADVSRDAPIEADAVEVPGDPTVQMIKTAIHTVKAMLNEARIALPADFELEISHHYGMENFLATGTVIIDCVNRSYCKKLLVQLPGQRNPLHYHKLKEETFQILSGVLELEIDRRRKTLYPGDTLLVLPGVWHAFWTEGGAIFEEISTTHYNDDSFYADKAINRMDRSARKTVVDHWGRYQLSSS